MPISPLQARLLLEAGADPNVRTSDDGHTALMWCAQEGHVDMARLLLDGGADPELVRASDGRTAVMLAAQDGFLSVVELLGRLCDGDDVDTGAN